MGVWRDESRSWRRVLQGEALAMAAPIRVGTGSGAELTHRNAMMFLGAGSRMTPIGTGKKLTAIKFDRGSLRVIASKAGDPVRIETELGEVLLSPGAETAS